MDIVERLVAYKDYTGLTNSQFADKAGIPRPTLSQFLNGRNKRLSDELTAKLHTAYPDLNVMWLLFGEGDMVKDSNIEISEGINDLFSSQNATQVPENKASETAHEPPKNMRREDTIRENPVEMPHFDRREPSEVLSEPGARRFTPNEMQTVQPFLPVNPSKRIQSIMVCYSDNSFEIFTPAPGQ